MALLSGGGFRDTFGPRAGGNNGLYDPTVARNANIDITNMPGYGYLDYEHGPDTKFYQTKNESISQTPTNVWYGANQRVPGALDRYQNMAATLYGSQPRFQDANLMKTFQGAQAAQNALQGGRGIDYLGRLGISEGLSNIQAQNAAQNRNLSSQLGRNPGNSSLINALQSQNSIRSQLAMQPLFSEAQRGSYERALSNIGVNNQAQQMGNEAAMSQINLNNQNRLGAFQAQLSALQPQQSLIEALANFQGQAKGLSSGQRTFGATNYK